jgi:phosphoglycolate phosphatase
MSENSIPGHIVFDCDGTLISSHEAVIQGLGYLMTEHLERDVPLSEVREKYSGDMSTVARNFGIDIRDQKLAQQLLKRWAEICGRREFNYALFEGIKDLLLQLGALDYKIYVWTARDRASTLAILKRLGIIQLFEDFRCVDDTIPKPHPMGLEELVGQFDRGQTMMIGDSTGDMNGAKSFGCASIAALWERSASWESLEGAGANYSALEPMSCLEIIKEHTSHV